MSAKRKILVACLSAVLAFAGCGTGPAAGRFATQENTILADAPSDDAGVRQLLHDQADAWTALAALLEKRQIGGTPVGADFGELVTEITQLAQRQRALIDAGQDDPTASRAALEQMKKMWAQAATYLGS